MPSTVDMSTELPRRYCLTKLHILDGRGAFFCSGFFFFFLDQAMSVICEMTGRVLEATITRPATVRASLLSP